MAQPHGTHEDHGHGPRRPIRVAAAALVSGLLLVITACGSGGSAERAVGNRTSSRLMQVATPVDGPVPTSVEDLPLRDSSGRRVTLASLKGKVVVISDSMTLCSEDCPLDTANVVTAARRTDAAGLAAKVQFLTVTVDPERDTPSRLRLYRAMYTPAHDLPNWSLLTGPPADLALLWKYFGVYWKRVPEDTPPDRDWMTNKPLTYDVAHDDDVLVLDARGNERYVISGHAHVPRTVALPTTMRHFLSPEGVKHLNRPGAGTWTPDDVTTLISKLTGRPITAS